MLGTDNIYGPYFEFHMCGKLQDGVQRSVKGIWHYIDQMLIIMSTQELVNSYAILHEVTII